MGAWDWIKDKASYVIPGSSNTYKIADPANLTGLNGDDMQKQPGVTANGPSSPHDLQRDPVTGMYFDPTTGNAYTDPQGFNQVTNPNVAQQVATNYQQGQALLGHVAEARKAAGQATAGQAGLVQNLNGVISGATPSVAGTQLANTLGGIQRTQSSLASGYGGNNAFAARRTAAQNIGNAQQQASQQAATLRAQETAAAMQAKGNVLNSMATNANTQAAQDIAGGSEFAGLASKGQMAQQGMDTAADKEKTEAATKRKAGLPALIGSLFA